MARTTLTIDDRLIRQLKRKAVEEGRTLQAVTNELLRQALATPPRRSFTLTLQGWKAREQPRVDILDRDKLFDLMNGR
jgi:hypothetical protein